MAPAAGQGEDCIGRRPAEFGRTVAVVFGGEVRTRGVLKAPCPRGPPGSHGNLDGGAKRVSRRNRGPRGSWGSGPVPDFSPSRGLQIRAQAGRHLTEAL